VRKNRTKAKPLKTNKNTILLIVENSEASFYNQYFKQELKEKYNIDIKCETSGSSNKCNILNFRKMTNRINEAIEEDKYKFVFLMLDLKTNCRSLNINHTCLVKLKNEYEKEYKINQKSKFYLFVVCNEIESWFLTIKQNTDNVNDNHKEILKKLLAVQSEQQIVQNMIKNLKSKKFNLDFNKNISFKYFIEKLILVAR